MKMIRQKEKRDTLEGILSGSWAMLKKGAGHFNDPFHWPVLGTLGKDRCSQRSVILRQLILPERILVCNTDARAGKVKEIKNNPRVSWLFYHPRQKIQLRISGIATLHMDDTFADEQWAATPVPSRLNYCAVLAPGSPVDKSSAGLPDFLVKKMPSLMNTEKGRKHFLTISSTIDSLDWLSLSIFGNRRARYEWQENELTSSWLIP